MFDLPTDLLLDLLVAVLLAATIFFCVLLDRRLKALRSGQDGLKAIIDQLNTATSRAEMSIGQLKRVSGDADTGLNDQLRQARLVTDELSVMLASGNKLADRLSGDRPSGAMAPDEPKIVPLNKNETGAASPSLIRSEPLEEAEQLASGLNQTLLDALKKAR